MIVRILLVQTIIYALWITAKREVSDMADMCGDNRTDCDTCRHYKLACELFSEVCKYEPKTQSEIQNSNLTFEKRTMRDCYNCRRYETEDECIECHYESKDEPKICDTCRYYNSRIPCGSTPSACKEADKFAEEFVNSLKNLRQATDRKEQMMTLDEAIIHAESEVQKNEREADRCSRHGGSVYEEKAKSCRACANEHRQLVEWLKELQELRAKNKSQTSEIIEAYARGWTDGADAVKDILQADCGKCAEYGSYKCTKCDGEMYFKDEFHEDHEDCEIYSKKLKLQNREKILL